MNGPERASHYHTLVHYDDKGRILHSRSKPRDWGVPSWAVEDPEHVLELCGFRQVHAGSSYVQEGELLSREVLTLRPDQPSVLAGETHTVRAYTASGDEIRGLSVVVDRRFTDTIPVEVVWDNGARVRVELDDVTHHADPIRIRFEEE